MENLFNTENVDRNELFQQYRMFVDSAEKISERRNHLNMLCNYRALNKAKFTIIQEIEKKLPLNLYSLEWNLYKKRKHRFNPSRYLSFSRLEMVLPWLLIAIYLCIILITYYNHNV